MVRTFKNCSRTFLKQMYKPDSVSAKSGRLSFLLPFCCQKDLCGTPLFLGRGTALHPGKDLAVSPLLLQEGLIPEGMLTSFEIQRLCSHLAPRGVWELPTTCCQFCLLSAQNFTSRADKIGECPDFPRSLPEGGVAR